MRRAHALQHLPSCRRPRRRGRRCAEGQWRPHQCRSSVHFDSLLRGPHVNVRKLFVIAIALSVVPFASHAKQGPQAALDACIKAFVESHLSGREVRQLTRRLPASGPLETFWTPRRYTIALSAHATNSGELVAHARCVASSSGELITLDRSTTPLQRAPADFTVSLR